MVTVYLLVAAALAVFLWLAIGIRRIGAISQGHPIGDRPETALLLVDLQSVFWDNGPYSEAAKIAAESVIEAEIKSARADGLPIVALRQEWSIPSTKAVARLLMKGQAVEGTPGTELAAPFADQVDHVVVKRVQDGFETGELDALFKKLDVGTLRVVGLDFNFCVQKTAIAAQNRGYAVTVIKGGTLSAAATDRSEKLMRTSKVALL